MKALITETFPHYLMRSFAPDFPVDNLDDEINLKALTKILGLSHEKALSHIQKFKSNENDQNFQGLCSSARLIFDQVDNFIPYHPNNAGLDEFYGFPSREYLYHFIIFLHQIHERNPNALLSEEDTISLVGEPMPIDNANFVKNFVPSLNKDTGESPIILSRDSFYTNQYLAKMNVNTSEAMLAVLATAGISFCLPAVYAVDDEMVGTIKEKFSEELNEYKSHLENNIEQVRAGLSEDGANINDIWDFAHDNFSLKLKLKAEAIEIAVSKAEQKVKEGVWKGVKGSGPEIGSSMRTTGSSLREAVYKQMLNVFYPGYRTQMKYEEFKEKFPEAAYLYQIRKMGKG